MEVFGGIQINKLTHEKKLSKLPTLYLKMVALWNFGNLEKLNSLL